MAIGSYNYDLTYMDSTFNLFSEKVKVDLVKKNESPSVNTNNAEIVINSKPFSNVEIKDDVGIESIDIVLKSGFSNNLSLTQIKIVKMTFQLHGMMILIQSHFLEMAV